jgi:hypothetical protein
MNPISIHRAFDQQLDRVLNELAEEDASPTLEGFVGSIEVAVMFVLATWAIWLWL